MSWLFPIYLLAASAIAIPLMLHFLRRWPRRPVVFPALRLLAPLTRRAEARTQSLRRWIVLALRCLALTLLAFIFARPFVGSNTPRESRAVVLVVDNSLSLQATDRWPDIQLWARDKLGQLAPGDRLAVMLASPAPAWLVAPTTEVDRAMTALAEVKPGWQSSRLDPALRLAANALVGIPADRREIIVLTDHQRTAWLGADFGRPLAPGIRLVFPDPAPRVQRQAALMTPVLTAAGDNLRASVLIRNYGARHARTLRVFRDDEGTPLQEIALTLGASDVQSTVVSLPDAAKKPGRFRFSLDADDLPADDTAHAVWQPREAGLVLLDGNPTAPSTDFLTAALKVTSDLPPKLAVRPLNNEDWPAEAVMVLRSEATFASPMRARLEAFLSGGGTALVFAPAGNGLREWLAGREVKLKPLSGQPEAWRVRDWQLEHPLVAAAGRHRLGVLLDWEFRSGWALSSDSLEPLAYWSASQAAIAELRVGTGHLLVCGFAPDRSAGDWPNTPAFVQFVHQACVYLLNNQRAITQSGEVGVTLRLPSPGRWQGRSGPASTLPAENVTESVVPAAPGVYEFTANSSSTWYAINVSNEESDLAGWDAGTPWMKLERAAPAATPPAQSNQSPDAPLTRDQAEDAEQRQPLWWWAAVAAFFLIMAELALANRTTR